MTEHKDHRSRMRDRFLKEGLDNFNDINALELLLFYCIPQKDTNPLAHALVDAFGNLAGVLDAKKEDLLKVPGVGKNIATFLLLLRETSRFYQVEQSLPGRVLANLNECGNYLMPYFVGREVETIFMLCLDAKCKVICCRMVGEGSINSANISVRKIVEIAINANATTVILAHNHPSGLAIPSGDDVQTTGRIAKALELVDVNLADHLVFSGNDFVSIVQSNYFPLKSD